MPDIHKELRETVPIPSVPRPRLAGTGVPLSPPESLDEVEKTAARWQKLTILLSEDRVKSHLLTRSFHTIRTV